MDLPPIRKMQDFSLHTSKIPQIRRCLSTFACIRKNKFVPKFYPIAYCFKNLIQTTLTKYDMQKVVKRDFTTAFMVLELTWGSLDRKQQSLFIKGTPQQWLPCRNPYLSRVTIRPRGRLKVEQIVKRYLAHRLKQLWATIRTNPHPEKNKAGN